MQQSQLQPRKNVLNKETGILMRVSATKADQMVKEEGYVYTTKNKLKSYLNKQNKLYRNFNFLKGRGVEDINKEKLYKLPSGNIHIKFTSQKHYSTITNKEGKSTTITSTNVRSILEQHFNVQFAEN